MFFLFYRLFINFVNIDNHFKVIHVILSENKKSFYLLLLLVKHQKVSKYYAHGCLY